MSKTFLYAGTCTEKGATVYKFANDVNRAKALERFGCTDVNMIALPEAMDKDAAVAYLATKGVTATKAPRVAKEATVKVKATKAVVTKAKRVPAELKPGVDAAAFFDAWMTDRTSKATAWRVKNGIK